MYLESVHPCYEKVVYSAENNTSKEENRPSRRGSIFSATLLRKPRSHGVHHIQTPATQSRIVSFTAKINTSPLNLAHSSPRECTLSRRCETPPSWFKFLKNKIHRFILWNLSLIFYSNYRTFVQNKSYFVSQVNDSWISLRDLSLINIWKKKKKKEIFHRINIRRTIESNTQKSLQIVPIYFYITCKKKNFNSFKFEREKGKEKNRSTPIKLKILIIMIIFNSANRVVGEGEREVRS